MRAPCEALVLEDDPEQMEAVVQAMREVYLEPLAASSPDRALNKLRYYQPVMAVLDLDMSMAPESKASVADVLQDVGSPVEIVDLGHRCYTLEVAQAAGQPAVSGEA